MTMAIYAQAVDDADRDAADAVASYLLQESNPDAPIASTAAH